MSNGSSVPSQPIQRIQIVGASLPGLVRWSPAVGEEAMFLLDHIGLQGEQRERLLTESCGILGRCTPPNEPDDSEIGLVIGNVQSGKTMSFTTVTALARDNGFRLVIVITGVSTSLFDQSNRRITRDLQLTTRQEAGVPRRWKHFANPSTRGPERAVIVDTLAEWNDPEVPEREKQTVLVTVMKNHSRLRHLTTLLSQLNLHGVPALVIDDEADQAGLNSLVNQRGESTTYRRLLGLRQTLPFHTYLQYTATPQAPLLINIIDTLSPKFAELLTPGDDYIGGREFFIENPALVRLIPANELPAGGVVMSSPPESLLKALRLFLAGIAAAVVRGEIGGNRSMLVHPSQGTMRHVEYFQWIRDAKTAWQRALSLPEDDPDRLDVLEDFRAAHQDLATTVQDLPPFDEVAKRLRRAMTLTAEQEVNARGGRTPPVEFHSTYGHILVGGQAMDRGFTVEGLTVTYMPRGLGVGNADTVQQRARFFGYKRGYLPYCRVYLEQATRDAYGSYVVHEDHMRKELLQHRERALPLSLWKRTFLLAPNLRPTRDEVLDLGYMRFNFGDEWYWNRVPHELSEVTVANRDLLARVRNELRFIPDEGDSRRTAPQRHLVAEGLPLERVMEDLLMQFRVTRPSESVRFTALLIHLRQYLERVPAAVGSLYLMSRGADPTHCRERPVNASGELTTYLHQGANANTGYPGDANVGDASVVRVQAHFLKVVREGSTIENDVPCLAVWVPREVAEDVIVQS